MANAWIFISVVAGWKPALQCARFETIVDQKTEMMRSEDQLLTPRRFWGPCEPPSSAAVPGAVGGFMFERVAAQRIARVRICRPAWRATQGSRPTGRPANRGALLFGYLFLGQARKSDCPAGAWPALKKSARSANYKRRVTLR